MSALTPKPPDDATNTLMPQHVALHEPETCRACRLPLVVCEKKLINEKASRRFWCLCPECGYGYEVLAQHVVNGVSVPMAEGACMFDCSPHRRTHKIDWSCKPPAGRKPSKNKKGKKKR